MNIKAENKLRLLEFSTPYNPITGEGSKTDRFKMMGPGDIAFYLPKTMEDNAIVVAYNDGTLDPVKEAAWEAVQELRLKHDFEYWAYTAIKIEPKIGGNMIEFKLNKAQRRYITKLEKPRVARKPIRIILLKSRQWGGSTLTQMFILWVQNIHNTNWHSCIVALQDSQVATIQMMYDLAADEYPPKIGSITLKAFKGSSKNKIIKETGSRIHLGSFEKPDALRSGNYKMAHISEVGLARATKTKTPADMVQTIIGSITPIPDTLIVQESTAKGVGNYFHKLYTSSKAGNTTYTCVFVPWFEFEDNMMDVDDYDEFILSLSDYEHFLWRKGAALEQISWYRWKLKEYNHDEWRMRSEFPTTEEEAFQSTGHRVFPIDYVTRNRKNIEDPEFIGEWLADGNKGPDALKNIHWHNDPLGNTKVWSMPELGYLNRYLMVIDIGGTTKGADWSIIKMIDRYWASKGGKDETALVAALHVDVDLLVWKAATIGMAYGVALYVIEKNSLNRKKDAGENYYVSLEEVAEHYHNMYKRKGKEEEEQEGAEVKYGFHTNKATKPMIVKQLKAALRDETRIIRDVETLDECDTYEEKENGEYAAVDGCNDDRLITEAIGNHISVHVMEPCKPKPTATKRKKSKGHMAKI